MLSNWAELPMSMGLVDVITSHMTDSTPYKHSSSVKGGSSDPCMCCCSRSQL